MAGAATTHHAAFDDLRSFGTDVVEARFVDDGDLLTAGGVTSGIDLALHIVEKVAGVTIAENVAREIEHELARSAERGVEVGRDRRGDASPPTGRSRRARRWRRRRGRR